ncbi:MAG TPA: hypothetical protein VJU59_07950, partial [Paraburkholderia sp.]|uniref:hypothetical protein n=1 Tax=Paraburkholderia sp. TaxID=1926495 RepID=UPI002B463A80
CEAGQSGAVHNNVAGGRGIFPWGRCDQFAGWAVLPASGRWGSRYSNRSIYLQGGVDYVKLQHGQDMPSN